MDLFHQICRSCNNERKNMLNIFESKLLAKSIHIEEMLSCCSQEPVTIDDKYPKQICYLCAKQLEITYKFLLQYKKSKQQFDQIFKYIEKCEPEDEGQNESDILGFKHECVEEYDDKQTQLLTDESNTSNEALHGTSVNSYMENQSNFNSKNHFHKSEESASEYIITHKENRTKEIETRIHCSYCTKSFFTAKALILHEKISHKQTLKSKSKLCSKCGEVQENNSLLDEHIKTCIAKTPMYKCANCSKPFISKVNLQQHMQICFE